jgi:hypothetical protein
VSFLPMPRAKLFSIGYIFEHKERTNYSVFWAHKNSSMAKLTNFWHICLNFFTIKDKIMGHD